MTAASRARTDRDPTHWQGGRLLLTGEKPAMPEDDDALQDLIAGDTATRETRCGFDADSEAGQRRLALNPNCRGITVPELQSIDFDLINFSDFYEDLMKNQKIPNTDTMVKQVKDRIAAQVQQQQGAAK